ncbi:MAG: hypothetical protein WEE64_02925 [Dehalococcoidia bacterium]
MASRFEYTLPTVRRALLSAARRVMPGGLAASLSYPADGDFVMVTGPGRSGTSAVARVLHESGVTMGDALRPASEFNPVGFYEEEPVVLLNDGILLELGMERFDRWPSRAAVLAVGERYAAQMRELVAKTSVDGWKDPRFSTTLEAWLPHLPRRPKIVICLRSPDAYLHSVVRIYGLVDRGVIERSWEWQLTRLLDVVRDYHLDATCVEYDALIQQPDETVRALSEFVGRELDPQYVEGKLRQFVQPVSPRFAGLYDRVRTLGGVRPSAPPVSPDTARAYVEAMLALEERVAAAKAAWNDAVGMPEPALARANGSSETAAPAIRAAHNTSTRYFDALGEAQAQLDALFPPPGFERYHELAREFVDTERLVAYFFQSLTQGDDLDRERLTNTITAWRKLCSPEVASAAAKARARERERAKGLVGTDP